jgi:hypothetical protein
MAGAGDRPGFGRMAELTMGASGAVRAPCDQEPRSLEDFVRFWLEFRLLGAGLNGSKPGFLGRASILELGCFLPYAAGASSKNRFSTTAGFAGGLQGPAARALGEF